MAPQEEEPSAGTVELTLEVVDAAIKAVKSDDLDINPFTVARQLNIEPSQLFESKEFMGQVIQARRKSQGDSATFSMDSELARKVGELEAELSKLADINSDLYDRGVALEDQVIGLEERITELEQEAETLAMQLQNSWHLGYNKGLADGQKNVAKDESAVQTQTGESPAIGHDTSEHEVVSEVMGNELSSQDVEEESKEEPDKDAADKDDKLLNQGSPAEQTKEIVEAQETTKAPAQETTKETGEEILQTGDFQALEPSYNETVFNAAGSTFVPADSKENYASFSWREIETVYQYSTVAGRPNINLYFEPFVTAPTLPESVEELIENPGNMQGDTSDYPAFQKAQAQAAQAAEIKSQNETQPIPGAAAFFQAQAKAEEAAKAAPTKKRKTEEAYVKSFMQADGLDPHDLNLGGGSLFQKENPVEERISAELATHDQLDAVKIEEKTDELDLEKLDIFAGIEDIEELSQIEVIEDVVLPPQTAPEAPKQGSEDLRELIKNRIKQAESEPATTAENAPAEQVTTGQNVKLDAEALKAGARNKFVGGKAATNTAPEASGTAAHPAPAPRVVPPEIRKACMILGVRPEEITVKIVVDAWKREMSQPGVHPDTGGDTETAIYLNNAKVELVKWIEAQTPKLGKKFGAQQSANKPAQESGKPFIMGQKKDKDKK